MSSPPRQTGHSTGGYYGSVTYATLVVTCYAGFFARQYYYTSEWMVPVVFALGAIFGGLGVLGHAMDDCGGRVRSAAYYLVQGLVLTGIVFLSPTRGFMGLIVLPLVSEAIFDLRPRYAVLIGTYLFGINLAVWWEPFGWASVSQTAINYFAAFAFTVAFTVIAKQALEGRRREQRLRQEVEAANQLLRDQAAQTAALATARERNRLAREIHDGLGHYLTVVKTQLDAAAALMPVQPERALEAVAKAARLTGDALGDVRRSVGSLRTDAAPPALPEALRALAHEAGLPVTVQVEGAARPLPPGIEHALFRSAQEGLTNIRKHAAASAAEVALDFRPAGRVRLAVTDNGRGARGATADGFGLIGIRERIALIGGRVESGNRREGGFALTVEVPA
jgi:signal transduction histidine kinase